MFFATIKYFYTSVLCNLLPILVLAGVCGLSCLANPLRAVQSTTAYIEPDIAKMELQLFHHSNGLIAISSRLAKLEEAVFGVASNGTTAHRLAALKAALSGPAQLLVFESIPGQGINDYVSFIDSSKNLDPSSEECVGTIKRWSDSERCEVTRLISECLGRNPGLLQCAANNKRIVLCRSNQLYGGYNFFQGVTLACVFECTQPVMIISDEFFRQRDGLLTITHELVHLCDRGEQISSSRSWKAFALPKIRRLRKLCSADQSLAERTKCLKRIGDMPSLYACVDLQEALAEWGARVLIYGCQTSTDREFESRFLSLLLDQKARLAWSQHSLMGERALARYDYNTAEEEFKEAIRTDPGGTTIARDGLCTCLVELDRKFEAESLLEETMRTCEKDYGKNSLEAARSYSQLAAFLLERGRTGEAGTLFERVLTIRERELTAGSEELISSYENLSACRQDCEDLLKRAISKLGARKRSDRVSIRVWNALAEHYESSFGTLTLAETIYKANIAALEKEVGREKELAQALIKLADMYADNADCGFPRWHDLAENLYVRSQRLAEKDLVACKTVEILALQGRARAYCRRRQYENASQLLGKAIAIENVSLSPTVSPTLVVALIANGNCLYALHRLNAAEDMFSQAITLMEDEPHFSLTKWSQMSDSVRERLAALYLRHNQLDKAVELVTSVISFRKMNNAEAEDVEQAIQNLGDLYVRIGRLDLAESTFSEELQLATKTEDMFQPDAAKARAALAEAYLMDGKEKAADQLYEQLLSKCQETAAASGDVANCEAHVAWYYYRRHKYAEAEQMLERALSIRRMMLTRNWLQRSLFMTVGANLIEVYLKSGKRRKAADLLQSLVDSEKQLRTKGHVAVGRIDHLEMATPADQLNSPEGVLLNAASDLYGDKPPKQIAELLSGLDAFRSLAISDPCPKWLEIARAHYMHGRFAQCESVLEKSYLKNPMNRTAWFNLINAKYEQHKFSECLDFRRKPEFVQEPEDMTGIRIDWSSKHRFASCSTHESELVYRNSMGESRVEPDFVRSPFRTDPDWDCYESHFWAADEAARKGYESLDDWSIPRYSARVNRVVVAAWWSVKAANSLRELGQYDNAAAMYRDALCLLEKSNSAKPLFTAAQLEYAVLLNRMKRKQTPPTATSTARPH